MKNEFPMRLVGEDGNAFALMAKFRRGALRAGWTEEEIEEVIDDATSGDYDHLLATLTSHTTDHG